jgi:hypothetical protein
MKLKKSGWLKEYLNLRGELLKDTTDEISRGSSYPDQSLYRLLQPTGLMYGQNIGTWDSHISSQWTDKEKMKILLAESFISSSLLFYGKQITNAKELSDVIDNTIIKIGNFYNNIFPEIAIPTKSLFGKARLPVDIAESILEKRVETGTKFQHNFWINFFHNSLLFLDIFLFGRWIHTKSDKIIIEFFKSEKEAIRFSIVKIIAAAAHSNMNIEEEERNFFKFFLEGANLKGDKRKEALAIFEKGIDLQEIELHQSSSWILKKYLLELGLLTIWSDKKVEDLEHGFLVELCNYFELNEEDLENSIIAIEGFVLGHWDQLESLKDQEDFNRVSDQFITRVHRIVDKNKKMISRGIKENPELLRLLLKAKSNELNEAEKEKVRYALLDILKTIPAFLINSLPYNFLTLNNILKILPGDLISEALSE